VDVGRTEAAEGPADLQQWAEFYEVLDTLPEEERTVVDHRYTLPSRQLKGS
jgi:hypothetical protein